MKTQYIIPATTTTLIVGCTILVGSAPKLPTGGQMDYISGDAPYRHPVQGL